MVRMSVLADCLKSIYNAEKKGKRQVMIRPSSKIIVKFLSVMQKAGKLCHLCIGSFASVHGCCCWLWHLANCSI
jgi:ribosomal protein S8